jgi:hypothetical protein
VNVHARALDHRLAILALVGCARSSDPWGEDRYYGDRYYRSSRPDADSCRTDRLIDRCGRPWRAREPVRPWYRQGCRHWRRCRRGRGRRPRASALARGLLSIGQSTLTSALTHPSWQTNSVRMAWTCAGMKEDLDHSRRDLIGRGQSCVRRLRARGIPRPWRCAGIRGTYVELWRSR